MKNEKQALVPRLRFPEFRGAGEWQERKLGEKDIASFVKKRVSRSDLRLESYISTENLLPDFGGKKRAAKLPPSGSFTSFKPGDILIANIRPYLKKVWVADFYGAASNDVIVIRPMDGIRGSFLSALLKNDAFIDYVMEGAKGVKMPRGDVSLMKEYSLVVPDPREQQKIADCLSSLDALIAAQAEKLDALKTHKKGLMQQLFPREGETVPRLRFPEFRDAGEWKQKKLGRLIEEYREKSTKQDEFEVLTSAREGLVRQRDYYDNSRITERNNIGFNIIPPCYMTYRSRSDDRRFFFNENNLGLTGIISTYYPVFRMLDGSNKFFVELLSQYSRKIGKHSVGTSQTVLSMNELRKIELPIPKKEEQQKIADCLASLDALTAVQAEKIDALKAHKKGLMQQLFPSPEAVVV